MENSHTKKKAIEILEKALSKKDRDADSPEEFITAEDLEKMAAELDISKSELELAAAEVTSMIEKNRSELFPEAITTRRINGRLTDQEIENIIADINIEFGGAKKWDGSPAELHKSGNTWEYSLRDASVFIKKEGGGYLLHVTTSQFFHGNILEAAALAIPVAFIFGLLPVAAAYEWIHLLAAIFVGAACYLFSLAMVKKFTNNKRDKTVSRLLRISEYIEQKMKILTDEKEIHSDTELENETEEDVETSARHRNRQHS